MQDCQILAEELQEEDVRDRRRAARMLAMLGEAAHPAALKLLSALEDADEEVCNWVTEALENLGSPQLVDLEELIQVARNAGSADAQFYALKLIGRLGTRAKVNQSALLPCLDASRSSEVRVQTVRTLAATCDDAPQEDVREAFNALEQENDPVLQGALKRYFNSTK